MNENDENEGLPRLPISGMTFSQFKILCKDVDPEDLVALVRDMGKVMKRVLALEDGLSKAASDRARAEFLCLELEDMLKDTEELLKKHSKPGSLHTLPVKAIDAALRMRLVETQLELATSGG